MFFFYACALSGTLLLGNDFTAANYSLSVIATAIFLALMTKFYTKTRHIAIFTPIVLFSFCSHISLFIQEVRTHFVKDVNPWLLLALITAVCFYAAFAGDKALRRTAVPVFILIMITAALNMFGAQIAQPRLVSEDSFQYVKAVASSFSVSVSLCYMYSGKRKAILTSLAAAITVSVIFLLLHNAFFKSIALCFLTPFVCSCELILLRSVIIPIKKNIE